MLQVKPFIKCGTSLVAVGVAVVICGASVLANSLDCHAYSVVQIVSILFSFELRCSLVLLGDVNTLLQQPLDSSIHTILDCGANIPSHINHLESSYFPRYTAFVGYHFENLSTTFQIRVVWGFRDPMMSSLLYLGWFVELNLRKVTMFWKPLHCLRQLLFK